MIRVLRGVFLVGFATVPWLVAFRLRFWRRRLDAAVADRVVAEAESIVSDAAVRIARQEQTDG